MVGMVVDDMAASLAFYRTLGLDLPEGSESSSHVEAKMDGDVILFWDSAFVDTYDPERTTPAGGYRVLLEFAVGGKREVDTRYAELTGHGYRGHRAPFDTSFGTYLAMVDDPDGNTILLSDGQNRAENGRVSR